MESLEKLKAKRSVELTSISKFITKLEALLTEDVDNTKIDELQEKFCLRESTFQSLNHEMEDQLNDLQQYEKVLLIAKNKMLK